MCNYFCEFPATGSNNLIYIAFAIVCLQWPSSCTSFGEESTCRVRRPCSSLSTKSYLQQGMHVNLTDTAYCWLAGKTLWVELGHGKYFALFSLSSLSLLFCHGCLNGSCSKGSRVYTCRSHIALEFKK